MGFLDDLEDGATDIGETVADGADAAADAASDGYDVAEDAAHDTAEELYESSSSAYDSVEDAAADMYSSTADYVYNQADDVLSNPVETGETMVDFTVGSDESPPNPLQEYAESFGYDYIGSVSIGKICQIMTYLGAPTLFSISIATAGTAVVAAAVVGTITAVGCGIAGFIYQWGEDIGIDCTFSSAFIYSDSSDVLIVPYCT